MKEALTGRVLWIDEKTETENSVGKLPLENRFQTIFRFEHCADAITFCPE